MIKKFSKKHLWIAINGDIATLGMTDFLQEKLGDIIFINLPEPGEKVVIGERLGDVESKKTVMDLTSVVSGEVVEVNEDVVDEPYLVNDTPDESWLIRIRVEQIADDLLDEETYIKHISQPCMQSHK